MYRTTNLPNTRIEVADALRGIAVAGIILFHAREHFNLYWSGLDYVRAGFGGWEQTVAGALGFLLSGKMYAVFALLFGLSFFIQSDNQAQRGNDFSLRFAWRMILLFGIGLINAAIYNGDVLTYYAVFGLLMIPIGKLPNRWVWVIAALLFIQPLELYQHLSGHTLSLRGIEGMETLYPTLATGTFAQSARASLVYGPISSFAWGLEHGRATQTLLMFVLGMLAGLVRGRVESCLMRLCDVMLSFPGEVMVLAIVGMLGPGLENVVLACVVAKWPWYARMMRTITLRYADRDFVRFARVAGYGTGHIIRRHLLPCAAGEISVLATLDTGAVILMVSALSFLGLGVQPPTPEWGMMLGEAREVMVLYPWQMLPPGLAILLVVAACNYLGDSLRDALDPRHAMHKEPVL